MFDAEGTFAMETCPQCGSQNTVTYTYTEGFNELECQNCGYSSEEEEIVALTRYRGDLKEAKGSPGSLPPVPIKKLEA